MESRAASQWRIGHAHRYYHIAAVLRSVCEDDSERAGWCGDEELTSLYLTSSLHNALLLISMEARHMDTCAVTRSFLRIYLANFFPEA